MESTQPLTAVRLAGFVWLVCTPFLWLGAALSKMESVEQYNIQLGVVTVVSVVSVGAAFGAFAGHRWPRPVLLVLSWLAAGLWAYSGITLSTKTDIEFLPIVIGCCFAALAASLHLDGEADPDSPADHA